MRFRWAAVAGGMAGGPGSRWRPDALRAISYPRLRRTCQCSRWPPPSAASCYSPPGLPLPRRVRSAFAARTSRRSLRRCARRRRRTNCLRSRGLTWPELANRAVHARTQGTGEFVTAVCVAYHPSEASVRWASAGHPLPIALPAGTELEPTRYAAPLGLDPELKIATQHAPLTQADAILLYSDGLCEARGHATRSASTASWPPSRQNSSRCSVHAVGEDAMPG